MGSEGPPQAIAVNITGFKKFHGVPENPTQTIVENLKDFVSKRGLQKGLTLGSCSILETAGEGTLTTLYATLQSAIAEKDSPSPCPERIIWVHLGVNSGATKFAVEQQAVNEATFRYPDEMGWKPQKEPIIRADGEISRIRETSLPVNEISEALSKKGFDLMVSDELADSFATTSTIILFILLSKMGPNLFLFMCLSSRPLMRKLKCSLLQPYWTFLFPYASNCTYTICCSFYGDIATGNVKVCPFVKNT